MKNNKKESLADSFNEINGLFSGFNLVSPFFDLRSNLNAYSVNGKMSSFSHGNDDKPDIVTFYNNVAVVKISGPLYPGYSWWYGTGYGDIRDAIAKIRTNVAISTVIIHINSPGGTVQEAFETEEEIYSLSLEKNLISFIDGSATSGAALMTFSSDKIFISGRTTMTGSIGVVFRHVDSREWYKKFLGEEITSVAKGKYKDAGTDSRGYDEKAKKIFDEHCNHIYDVFADVASKRLGLSRAKIDKMESKVFLGENGIKNGLADDFAKLDDLIQMYDNKKTTPKMRSMKMTKNGCEKKVETAGESSESADSAGEALIRNERNRVLAILSRLGNGVDDLVIDLIKNGIKEDVADGRILDQILKNKKKTKIEFEMDLNESLDVDSTDLNTGEPSGKTEMTFEEKINMAWENNTDFASKSSMTVYFSKNIGELDKLIEEKTNAK